MTSAITVRPVPTAYDPAEGAVTVATPSCCCCCCCLCSTLAVASFAAAEAAFQAEERQRSTVLPLILGLLAVPVAIFTVIYGAQHVDDDWGWIVVVAVGLGGATFAGGLLAAGVPPWRSIGLAAALTAIGSAAFFVEIFAAVVTVFLLELASPFAAWGAWAIARSRHRRRAPEAYGWRGPEPAYPMVPGAAPRPPGYVPPPPPPPSGGTSPPPPPPPPSSEEW